MTSPRRRLRAARARRTSTRLHYAPDARAATRSSAPTAGARPTAATGSTHIESLGVDGDAAPLGPGAHASSATTASPTTSTGIRAAWIARGSSTRFRSLVEAREWATIARGLEQRAALLDRVLADLYGEQRLLTRGALPPELVLALPGFPAAAPRREAAGRHRAARRRGGSGARRPAGGFWVLGGSHADAVGRGVRARESHRHFAHAARASSTTAACSDSRRTFARCETPALARAARPREPARRAPHAGAAQRNVLRARLPRALPRASRSSRART